MSAAATQSDGFSPRAVFLMLLAGLVGFVGLGVLTAYAPELRARQQNGENALSRSAVGYAGLVRLLQAEGAPVVISRGKLPQPVGAPGLVVLTPPPGTTAKALAAAMAGVQRRMLVILPKWTYSVDPDHLGWALKEGLVPSPLAVSGFQGVVPQVRRAAGEAPATLHGVNGVFEYLDPLTTGAVSSLQTAVTGRQTLLADAAGQAILVQTAADRYVLSDPDLMDNRGMASLDTARTALTILDQLRAGQGPVVFDVTLNGFERSRSLLGLAFAPPFLGASLCALAAALAMGAHAAARFGPVRPPQSALALGKTALLDNTAMLIRLARREPKMGRRYAALVRRALARRVLAAGSGEPEAQIDLALDRLTPAGEPGFSTLVGEAYAARDTAELMRTVRRLYQRKTEMLGERH